MSMRLDYGNLDKIAIDYSALTQEVLVNNKQHLIAQ
jgi:hypothetical protein